jgi:hypothetical protein
MDGREVKIPTLRKTRRIGHPEKLNQSLGVDVRKWYHPIVGLRQQKKRERVAQPLIWNFGVAGALAFDF